MVLCRARDRLTRPARCVRVRGAPPCLSCGPGGVRAGGDEGVPGLHAGSVQAASAQLQLVWPCGVRQRSRCRTGALHDMHTARDHGGPGRCHRHRRQRAPWRRAEAPVVENGARCERHDRGVGPRLAAASGFRGATWRHCCQRWAKPFDGGEPAAREDWAARERLNLYRGASAEAALDILVERAAYSLH